MTATLNTASRGPAARLPTQRRTSLNITAALNAKLVQMARRTRLTKTAILEAALDSYYAVVMKSPDMTLGYVQVARPGDIDPKQLNCVPLCWSQAADADGAGSQSPRIWPWQPEFLMADGTRV